MPLTFNKWLAAYKKAAGIKSVAGNTRSLREDYNAGYSPEEAAEYNKRGYGPHFMALAASAEKWMRIVE